MGELVVSSLVRGDVRATRYAPYLGEIESLSTPNRPLEGKVYPELG